MTITDDHPTTTCPSWCATDHEAELQRRAAVLGRAVEGRLGRESILDTDHDRPDLAGDAEVDAVVEVTAADREAAAMDVEHGRPERGAGLRAAFPRRRYEAESGTGGSG